MYQQQQHLFGQKPKTKKNIEVKKNQKKRKWKKSIKIHEDQENEGQTKCIRNKNDGVGDHQENAKFYKTFSFRSGLDQEEKLGLCGSLVWILNDKQ